MKNKRKTRVFLFTVLAVSVARLFLSPATEAVSADRVKEVLLGGQAIGVKLYTKGVHVLKVSDVETAEGSEKPARDAGIKKGDYITHADGVEISSYEQFSNEIQNKEKVLITLLRDGKTYTKEIFPVKAKDGVFRAGLWVRDSAAGIGTVTFYDEENKIFAALGHGITDVDTKKMLLPGGGKAENVRVTSVTKGKEGVPGEINGDFLGVRIGEIYLNNETGAYFKYDAPVSGEKVQVADHSEVTEGNATIISTIDGTEPKPYSVRIVKVIKSSLFTTKGMLIEVTDEKLLQKTGGVVCGMSGSPIIQNGKLIGAVTHVFVNDPTRGYGIFIENMLAEAEKIK